MYSFEWRRRTFILKTHKWYDNFHPISNVCVVAAWNTRSGLWHVQLDWNSCEWNRGINIKLCHFAHLANTSYWTEQWEIFSLIVIAVSELTVLCMCVCVCVLHTNSSWVVVPLNIHIRSDFISTDIRLYASVVPNTIISKRKFSLYG